MRDVEKLSDLLQESWGSTRMASRGRLMEIGSLRGFVAESHGDWLGHAAYEIVVDALEIALLESLVWGRGVGGALLAACVDVARGRDLRRVWLVTTNDNTAALRFYQRHGFVLVALHPGAVIHARETIKPEIPLTGADDLPIRDEIELELPRAEWDDFVERYSWPNS